METRKLTEGLLDSLTSRSLWSESVKTRQSESISSITKEVSRMACCGASFARVFIRTSAVSQMRGAGMKSTMCSKTPKGIFIIL